MKIRYNFGEVRKMIFILLTITALAAVAQKRPWVSHDLYLGDTVNVVDGNNMRQGRWVILGKDKKGKDYRFYKPHQVIETGKYDNGKKTGDWKAYHSSGKLANEIIFANDVADGPAKFYNEEGKIITEGVLKGKDYVGDYFIYDLNGNKFKKTGAKKDKYAYLNFKGKVDKLGREIDHVKITVFRENYELYETENKKDGTFDLNLELNFIYTIRFTKDGFNDHSIILDANVYNIQDTSIYKLENWKIPMVDNLANMIGSDFITILLNKPAGKIYFNKKKKKFTSDGAYTHLFARQVKDISESTKFILAQTVTDNKKLEIENLRMEAERKMQEINMLKQAQELKEAEIRNKEAEISYQKLEGEKKQKDISIAEQSKKIKDLQIEQQQMELEKKQIEADKKSKEVERLAALRKIQEYELKEKQSALNESNQSLAMQVSENEKNAKELEYANKDKKMKEAELKQQMFYVWVLLGGVLLMALFAVFIFRSFQQKKKANLLLEQQAKEIHVQKSEIEEKSKLIEQKNIETEQSIQYAKRIQHAILPPKEEIAQHIKDYFILYKPKDIVSGDFYFFENKHSEDGKVYIASVDCTGHGVPGAFMSMIGHEKLKDALETETEPARILAHLNKGVKMALRQSTEANSTRDGMDLCLCAIQTKGANGVTNISYSGANRPLWIIRKDSTVLEEVKATKIAIGGLTQDDQEFEQHELQLKKGDTIYLSSDGYADQFGGPKRKKLMTGNFKGMLVKIQHLSIAKQHDHLNAFIEDWMSDIEQVDDILVIGIRI